MDGYEYDRWYRVVLNKKKPLTINLKSLDNDINPQFCVYNSDGNHINCPELVTNKNYRTATLPKGTYYIRIRHFYYGENLWGNSNSRIIQFSWK